MSQNPLLWFSKISFRFSFFQMSQNPLLWFSKILFLFFSLSLWIANCPYPSLFTSVFFRGTRPPTSISKHLLNVYIAMKTLLKMTLCYMNQNLLQPSCLPVLFQKSKEWGVKMKSLGKPLTQSYASRS